MSETQTRYKKPQAVKMLEQAAHRNSCYKHPTLKAEYIPKPKLRDDTANGLTKCIILLVELLGGQAERINSTGRVVMQHSRVWRGGKMIDQATPKYIPTAGVKGTADISATIGGRSVKIEVKVGRDRQREEQKAYQQQIERAGGLYVIARDLQGFADWYAGQFGGCLELLATQ